VASHLLQHCVVRIDWAKGAPRSPTKGGRSGAANPDGTSGTPRMKYVYLLQSVGHPRQRYIGLTSDVEARLEAHNAGQSTHTSKYRPWKLCVALAFADEGKARAFEAYLKTGSGWSFAKRHFW